MSSEADYWVGPTIGEGAFGHVVYGVHKETNREVAIKVMEVASQGNRLNLAKQKTQMILNERKILSLEEVKTSKWTVDLWAAFCGRAWACSSSSQSLYFVMKLATGGDLAGLIRRGLHLDHKRTWMEDSVEWYASQLIEAVDFLHSQGILHCDLKPENLLFDRSNGHLCIADFGSAVDTKEPNEELSLRGTALYACPEILRAASPSDLTKAVDYWSVGCILYDMLHGSSPFDRGSEALTVQAIVRYANGETPWEEVLSAAVDAKSDKPARDETTATDNDEDLEYYGPLQSLLRELLAVNPEDRISAWTNKVLLFVKSQETETNGEDGDCPKDVLLPVPEWLEEVEKSTLRDGNLGWAAYQL